MDIKQKVDFSDSGREIIIDGHRFYVWVHGCLEDPTEMLAGEYIHTHLRYEVHIPGEKGLRVQMERETVSLLSDELLIVAPNVYHFFLPNCDGRRCFSYYYPDSPDMKSPLKFQVPYIRCKVINEISLFLELIERERNNSMELHEDMEAHLFSCLMLSLLRCFEKRTSLISPIYDEYNQSTIDIMDQYFHIKHNNAPSKKELANLLNVSERQLERMVNSIFGMSFRQKVQKVRFDTARFLMQNFHYSADKIADMIGYSSGQAFYSAYRAYINKQKTE